MSTSVSLSLSRQKGYQAKIYLKQSKINDRNREHGWEGDIYTYCTYCTMYNFGVSEKELTWMQTSSDRHKWSFFEKFSSWDRTALGKYCGGSRHGQKVGWDHVSDRRASWAETEVKVKRTQFTRKFDGDRLFDPMMTSQAGRCSDWSVMKSEARAFEKSIPGRTETVRRFLLEKKNCGLKHESGIQIGRYTVKISSDNLVFIFFVSLGFFVFVRSSHSITCNFVQFWDRFP